MDSVLAHKISTIIPRLVEEAVFLDIVSQQYRPRLVAEPKHRLDTTVEELKSLGVTDLEELAIVAAANGQQFITIHNEEALRAAFSETGAA